MRFLARNVTLLIDRVTGVRARLGDSNGIRKTPITDEAIPHKKSTKSPRHEIKPKSRLVSFNETTRSKGRRVARVQETNFQAGSDVDPLGRRQTLLYNNTRVGPPYGRDLMDRFL